MSDYDWMNEQDLADPDDSVFRLSASSVKTHSNCPYQFYLAKVHRLDGDEGGKGYLELGSAVHESIENVLGRDRWRSGPRPMNQLRQDFVSEFRDWNPDVEDDLWDRGMTCLETCAKYMAEMRGDMTVKELEPEFNFGLGRPDISAKFKGFIDLTSESGEIIDWKTGKVREKGEIIQGSLYMRGYQELYGEAPSSIKFVYLKEGKVRELEPNDENWQTMLDHAKRCVQDIKREEYPPDPESSKCHWCDYEGFCHASPNGAGGVNFDTFRQRRAEF